MEGDMIYPREDQVAEALRWISEVFGTTGAQYQVVGGLAARAYGAKRPLVDLDFYVSARDLPRVLASVADFCVWGPERFRDENWDLTFSKLRKGGVQIELAEAEGAQFYSSVAGHWLDQQISFRDSEKITVLGEQLEIMPKDQLVEYKRALDRPEDRLDVTHIAGSW